MPGSGLLESLHLARMREHACEVRRCTCESMGEVKVRGTDVCVCVCVCLNSDVGG